MFHWLTRYKIFVLATKTVWTFSSSKISKGKEKWNLTGFEITVKHINIISKSNHLMFYETVTWSKNCLLKFCNLEDLQALWAHMKCYVHPLRKEKKKQGVKDNLGQGSGTYGSRARCGSFDHGIWLAWYFLNTIIRMKLFLYFSIYQTTNSSATPCSSRSHINSKKHVIKEKIKTFTIVWNCWFF